MEKPIDFAILDTRKGADAGIELQLVEMVTRQPMPGFVLRIRGYDSEAYQNKGLELQRRRLERRRDGKVPTDAESRNEEIEHLATLVISWPEGATIFGQPVTACSIMEVPEIREQVVAKAIARANFLQGSAKSS